MFAFSLALFITGTCGLIGSDEYVTLLWALESNRDICTNTTPLSVLACFIAGNTFTWDDWFRLETLDDSLQPTIDMLLNVSVFMWYGAVCPWDSFLHNDVIPLPRLIGLGILVLLVRRLPWVFALHKKIPQIEQVRQAIFVGFFGPVGVSAVFYLYITNEFLETLRGSDGELREDVAKLPEAVTVVVWFLCICSVVSSLSTKLRSLFFSSHVLKPPTHRSSMDLASRSENWATTSHAPSRAPSPTSMAAAARRHSTLAAVSTASGSACPHSPLLTTLLPPHAGTRSRPRTLTTTTGVRRALRRRRARDGILLMLGVVTVVLGGLEAL